MKQILITLTFTFFSTILLSQDRNCPSVINLAQMQTQDPVRYQRFMDLENFTANYIANQNNPNQRLIDPNGIIIIPVVVHVLHRGEAEGTGRNISLAQIQSQINVLNEDFRRLNADRVNTPAAFVPAASDYNIEFRLACQDPAGNPTNGVVRRLTNKNNFPLIETPNHTIDETAMGIKMTNISGDDPWLTDRYLNIWVCDLKNGVLGYATFPADYIAHPTWDGVVIATTAMGRVGNVTAPFDRGRTATHEIGHWLNLRHISGDAICGDDFVGDTPPQHNQNYNCPQFPHTSACAGNGTSGDMFMNYMDYTDDACMNIYTNGQRLRGSAIFAAGGPRAAFLNNYFKIQVPTTPINCTGTVNLTNPNCVLPTWTIISGPATISSGQSTNQLNINATGNGTVQLRATAGNYISETNITVTSSAPVIYNSYYVSDFVSSGLTQWNGNTWSINTFCWQDIPTEVTTNMNIQNGTAVWEKIPNTFGGVVWDQQGDNLWMAFKSETAQPLYRLTVTNSCGSVSKDYKFMPVDCGQLFTVSPNPASANVIISLAEDKNKQTLIKSEKANESSFSEVKIFDMQGNLKKHQQFNKVKQADINISDLKLGLYMIEVSDGVHKERHQLSVQK